MRWKCRTTPTALLREIWRVMAAGGQLLAVVPNRRGLWARMDTTPFGHGRPYSRSQITHLLREAWFTPVDWSEALYVPPIQRGWFLRSAAAWERTGATISAPFAGVHIVEATKQVYRAIPAKREKRRLVPALEPALAPSPGGRGNGSRREKKRAGRMPGPFASRIRTVVSCCRRRGRRRRGNPAACSAVRPRSARAAMPPPAVTREAVAALVVDCRSASAVRPVLAAAARR